MVNNTSTLGFSDARIELVQRACQYIADRADSAPTLAEIAAHVHLSPFHLQRTFKRVMGISPREYADAYRLNNLKHLLRECSSVTGALYDAGYGSSSRLYEHSDVSLGMTPATYSRGGAGMHIKYSLMDCHLGRMLVAVTERGICAVHLGQNDADLEAHLFNEYPAAHFERNRAHFCEWVEALLQYINHVRPHLDLPLDVQATAFERRVWQTLRDIPYGETRTYQEIATAMGVPDAVPDVVRACQANPTTIIVPCHRAVYEDGQASELYDNRQLLTRQTLLENELSYIHNGNDLIGE
jgi:AraC family transcriptional regulator of adaptative response/methylated-DNA-[protein]-cysteine methyltransferase